VGAKFLLYFCNVPCVTVRGSQDEGTRILSGLSPEGIETLMTPSRQDRPTGGKGSGCLQYTAHDHNRCTGVKQTSYVTDLKYFLAQRSLHL
jgi:hypothetical protein